MRSLIIAVAAAGLVALGAGTAAAQGPGSGASAIGAAESSPGVLSGNNFLVPIDVPLNVCGNSISAVGLLNPAIGNGCAN